MSLRSAVRELDARNLATLAAIAVALELVGLRTLAVDGWHTSTLAAIAAVDCVLLAAIAHVTIARPRGGWRLLGLRLGHVLRMLWLAGSIAALLGKLLGLNMGPLWALSPIMAELTVVLVLFTRGDLETRLEPLLPRPLLRAMVTEVQVLGAACAALLRRPLPVRAGFTSIASSQYPRLALVVALLTLVEAPAIHLAIHALHLAPWLHAAFGFAHVYSWLWILGDYRMLRASVHMLHDAALHLELGARARVVVVPYDAIERIELGAAAPGDARLTPMDAPNLRLLLSRDVEVSRLLRAAQKSRALALFVDDPAALAAALRLRLGA